MSEEKPAGNNFELERYRIELERERWAGEYSLRERELEIKSAEQRSRDAEIELKREDQNRAGWWNPLVVAIFAAAIAAAGNAIVTIVNGVQQRNIEDQKSEQARILEMIKTGDVERAAENLQFLLDSGLIDNPVRAEKVKAYLSARKPGTGAALPVGAGITPGILGPDDAVSVGALPRQEGVRAASRSVGRLRVTIDNRNSECTAFLVANDLALTAGHCTEGATSATLQFSEGNTKADYVVQLPPAVEIAGRTGISFSLLRVAGNPGEDWGTLSLSTLAPAVGEKLATVYFRGNERKLAVLAPDCKVIQTGEDSFHHGCDTGGGSSGAPVLSRDGRHVLGLHYARSNLGGEATRSDKISEAIKTHMDPK